MSITTGRKNFGLLCRPHHRRPIWAITPASWIFLGVEIWRHGAHGIHRVSSPAEKVFTVWALLEILFSIYHLIVVAQLSRKTSNIVLTSVDNVRRLYSRILHLGLHNAPANGALSRIPSHVPPSQLSMEDVPLLDRSDPRAVDFRQSLRSWFRNSPWSTLTRAHVSTWISWTIFNASVDTLSLEQKGVVSHAIDVIERRAGSKLPLEANDPTSAHIRPLLLTLDPMSIHCRPAIMYATINFVSFVCQEWYQWRFGAHHEQYGDLEYTTSIHFVTTAIPGKDNAPILFLHGLGIGITQYHLVITELLSNPAFNSRAIVIVIQPHITQSLFHPRHLSPLNREKTVRDLRGLILKTLNNNKASAPKTESCRPYGSVPHAWLLKAYPELLERSCFVDPVVFCLWEGDVCYNFVYKAPTNAIEVLSRYLVGSELGIANTIQRNFDWSANTLFLEEIPNALDPSRTMFFLGGKDAIVASDRVRRYLIAHGVTMKGLRYDEKRCTRGALEVGGSALASIIAWLEK
ncbi:hypothetical protein BS47DRAFT_1406719 [Hydnum rufescens UP504]|uniref:Alpha/beta-hydrolase n=1 Tax=Hydnum rufescens UP504 TaxID=1448309 RepID=A0A9P6AS37_9AGAM|nr:hypothetical protein BS47DRAFT_1406719 [Hydnum rufescens UP504]